MSVQQLDSPPQAKDTNDNKPVPNDATPDKKREEKNPSEEKNNDDKPPADDSAGRRRFLITLAVAAALFALLLALGVFPRLRARKTLTTQTKQAQGSLTQTEVMRPRPGPRITTLTLPANIQAIAETDITARASGYVREWRVDIGDRVKAGQVLAILDTPDVDQQVRQADAQVAQAQAQVIQQRAESARALANVAQARQNAEKQRQQLIQAQADLNLARLTADRYRYLAKEGAVAQQTADQQIAALNNNTANVAALKAAVEASKSDIAAYEAALQSAQANVTASQANLAASNANARRYAALVAFKAVRAPFSGVVTSRSVDAGTLTGSGSAAGGGSSSSAANGGGSAAGSAPANGGATAASNGANSSRNAMYNAAAPPVGASGASDNGSSAAGGDSALPASGGQAHPAQTNAGGNGAAGGGSAAAPAQAAFAGGGSGSDQGVGGAAVSPGTSLYHIARIDSVRVQINVPQSFASNILVGGRVQITAPEFARAPFQGRIARTASTLDPQTRTLLTEIVIPNPGRRLLPGTFTQVVFNVERKEAPLIIPDSALIVNANGTQVATVGQDKKVRLVSVTVGRDFGREAEALSGLTARDLVITSPSDQTREGTTVEPVFPQPKTQRGGQGAPGTQNPSGGQQKGGGQTPSGNQPAPQGGANAGRPANSGQSAEVNSRYGGSLNAAPAASPGPQKNP